MILAAVAPQWQSRRKSRDEIETHFVSNWFLGVLHRGVSVFVWPNSTLSKSRSLWSVVAICGADARKRAEFGSITYASSRDPASSSRCTPERHQEGNGVCMIKIVTIEREYGCGGGEIAQLVASRLGWKLWDQRLTEEIARLANCPKTVVEAREERNDPLYYRLFKSFMRGSYEGS